MARTKIGGLVPVTLKLDGETHNYLKNLYKEAGIPFNFSEIVREMETVIKKNSYVLKDILEAEKIDQVALRYRLQLIMANFFRIVGNFGTDAFNDLEK